MNRTPHALALLATLCLTFFSTPRDARADDPVAPPPPSAAPPPAPPPSDAPPSPAPPAPTPEEDAAKHKAHAAFDEGLALLKQRAFAEALARFEASRAAFKTRSATENIGVCLRALGHPDEAYRYFQLVLREFPDLPDDVRNRVTAQIREVEQSTGSIVLEVAGAPPTVAVDGRDRTSDATGPILVMPGRRTITLTRDGYVPKQIVVDVAPASTQTLKAELAVLLEAGRLAVTAVAADGTPAPPADVFVDGVGVGKTPWDGATSPGDHTVWISAGSGLGTEPSRVKVLVGRTTQTALKIEPLPATITIDVVPPDASIAVRGIDVGRGHFSGAVRTGPLTIAVSKPGLATEEREVDVAPGANKLAIELSPAAPPATFALDFTLGAPISPGFGGAAASCSACETSPAFGVSVRGTFAYELDFGFGVGASLGYTHLEQSIDDRRRAVEIVGAQPIDALADDHQAHDVFVPQLVAYFSFFRDVFPITARLGAGLAVGSLRSERTVTTADDATFLGRSISDENSSTLLSFVLTPGVRFALPIGDVVALGLGCDVDLFFPVDEPDFDAHDFTLQPRDAGNPSAASVARESLVGSVIVAPTPLLYVRFAL